MYFGYKSVNPSIYILFHLEQRYLFFII
jgi:hypothetical protein